LTQALGGDATRRSCNTRPVEDLVQLRQLPSESWRQLWRDLERKARRWTHRAYEAEDLVQESILQVLARGRSAPETAEQRAYFSGVLERQAALVARTAARRRRREQLWAESRDGGAGIETESEATPPVSRGINLDKLPRSLKTVAALLLADLSASEQQWILQLTPTAWRQRLSSLRRHIRDARPECPVTNAGEPPRSLGTKRPQLLAALRRHPASRLMTVDPDGHILIISAAGAHTSQGVGNGEKTDVRRLEE
jgi:DNA-directed RNA polymerase specialized sigma24 family protein